MMMDIETTESKALGTVSDVLYEGMIDFEYSIIYKIRIYHDAMV